MLRSKFYDCFSITKIIFNISIERETFSDISARFLELYDGFCDALAFL